MCEGTPYRFNRAIVREPGASVVDGLRSVDRGRPDPVVFRSEHAAYTRALARAGLEVISLPPLEEFPDSVFIEDTALVLPEGSVVLRPGAESRRAEAGVTEYVLASLGQEIHLIGPECSVDGGDILVIDSLVLVGLSHRTDQAGFEALKALLGQWGYTVRAVSVPDNVLHLKSDCSMLDEDTILATERLAGNGCLAPFRVLTVPAGEEAAANSIRVNGTLFVPAGFPATAALLTREGFRVEVLRISQAALLDGGLSCMSLRFRK